MFTATDLLVTAALVIMLCIVLYFLAKRGKMDTVRKIILSLVTRAELALGSGTGELKYADVVSRLYEVLPVFIRMLYTKKDIDNMIEDSVKKLKLILNSGVNLLAYADEDYLKASGIGTKKDKAVSKARDSIDEPD